MADETHPLEPMTPEDVEEAVWLVSRAMNPAEGRWAGRTMRQHFNCLRHGIDDGRAYFVWRRAKRLGGLGGLHHYLWGPEENVWLSWFVVEPSCQRQGHGTALLAAIESVALARGYKRLLVETYDGADFAAARGFYRSQGFCEVGRISDYLGDGSHMVIYRKDLARR
jgi:ribosomal protein S18 acetylase RimI-like enzyme